MKYSHLDSLVDKEGKSKEKHYIHREVKCSHLVPESARRWSMILVAGSKKSLESLPTSSVVCISRSPMCCPRSAPWSEQRGAIGQHTYEA
jgi:hypothetical protein